MRSTITVVMSLLIVFVNLPAAVFAQSDANPPATPTTEEARAIARAITSHALDIIAAGRGDFSDRIDDVEVTAGDVSVAARKLGVVAQVSRQRLQSVVPAKKSHHVGRWIAIGAAAFGAVMLVWFIHYANCGCG